MTAEGVFSKAHFLVLSVSRVLIWRTEQHAHTPVTDVEVLSCTLGNVTLVKTEIHKQL